MHMPAVKRRIQEIMFNVRIDDSVHNWSKLKLFCFLNRYIDFRSNDGTLSKFYWHLLTLKLAFVIMFEVSSYTCIVVQGICCQVAMYDSTVLHLLTGTPSGKSTVATSWGVHGRLKEIKDNRTLYRDFDYRPPNKGWPFDRWPLYWGSTVLLCARNAFFSVSSTCWLLEYCIVDSLHKLCTAKRLNQYEPVETFSCKEDHWLFSRIYT